MVARFRNYRPLFIFQRRDFVGRSVFEMNCDGHGFADLEFSLLQQLLVPVHRSLPAFVLVDGQAFERLNRGFWARPVSSSSLENVDVVIDPLQADIHEAPTCVWDRLPRVSECSCRRGGDEPQGGVGAWLGAKSF